MSGQKRSDSFNLKHRLTGAAILIGFAVVILPMFLGSPPDSDSGQLSGTDGDTDTRVFRSNITPIGGATPNARRAGDDTGVASPAEPGAEPEDEAPAEQTASAADATPDDEATEPPAEPVSEPEDEAPASGETTTASAGSGQTVERGWIVQVGTFKNPANVDKLVAQLKNSGFGTSTAEVETSEGSATRVWVGPYETRVEAAKIKTRVKQQTGSEGLIVAYP